MAYQAIDSYGVIGDMQTAAMVGTTGSIDWWCFPYFDSPSVFAAILDDGEGGRFELAPAAGDYRSKQLYWPDSNVRVTRFVCHSRVAEVIECPFIQGNQLKLVAGDGMASKNAQDDGSEARAFSIFLRSVCIRRCEHRRMQQTAGPAAAKARILATF